MGLRPALGLHGQLFPAAAVVFGFALGALIGCPGGSQQPAAHPNVLLISIDSLRADTADGIGGTLATGPRLRRLAEESAVFTNASAAAPWTTPSMMSVLTGLYPWSHHVRDHNWKLAPDIPLLSERLKRLRYATAAIVPSATLREAFGFDRGFDLYDNGRYGAKGVTSPRMTEKALAWLNDWAKQTPRAPFFLWIHYWDPHYNYLPPPPFSQSFASGWSPPPGARYDMGKLKNREAALRPEELAWLRSQYQGELLYTDQYVGQLLDWLDAQSLRDDTLVVLIADHGEAFQEHGWLTHTMRVDEEMIHVPLVLRWPGHTTPGARLDEPVSLASVAPTILAAVGAEAGEIAAGEPAQPAARFDAASLWKRASGAASAPEPAPLVSETIRMASLAMLREGSWKYTLDMDACRGQLFDLASDPGETRDVAPEHARRAADMRARLIGWYRDAAPASQTHAVAMPEAQGENAELLRSLGYLDTAPGDRLGEVVTFGGKTDPLHCE